LGPLDPGQQDRPPAAAVERLLEMGGRAQDDEVVERAPAPEAHAARRPDMIELEPTEAIVLDVETTEDAAPVTGPDRGADRAWDRIRLAQLAASAWGTVAAEHGQLVWFEGSGGSSAGYPGNGLADAGPGRTLVPFEQAAGIEERGDRRSVDDDRQEAGALGSDVDDPEAGRWGKTHC
jgi:hypothetical protein